MKKNVGTKDAMIRVFLAISILFFVEDLSDSVTVILGCLSAILILTAVVGYCPLYVLPGLNTVKRKHL